MSVTRLGASRLFFKFLAFLIPVFIAVSGVALDFLSEHYVRREEASIAARVGSNLAKVNALVASQGVGDPVTIEPFLRLLLADQAIMCAEVSGADGELIAAAPPRIGCKGQDNYQRISLPITGTRATLTIRGSEAEIQAEQQSKREFSLLALFVGLLVALLGSWVGFRYIVARPINALLKAIRDSEQGKFAQVENTTRDELGLVTQAFNALQANSRTVMQRIDRLYHATPALMFTLTREGGIAGVSGHWSEATGYTARDATGQPLTSFLVGDASDRFRTLLGKLADLGDVRDEPLILRRANGEHMHVLLSASQDEGNADAQYLCVFSDVTDLRRAQASLQIQAVTDPLTGLANRKGLFEHIAALKRGKGRSRHVISAMFVDLDRFKQVNDKMGHAAGDLLLQQVALRLKACLLPDDFIARLGGDEFVLLLRDVPSSSSRVQIVAKAVLSALALPFDINGKQASIGASIGVAAHSATSDMGELIRQADAAMYTSKNAGHNQVTLYSDTVAVRRGRGPQR